uniref:Uncharacterized protein n=1 Tax=Timema genevievae TaxID=629358 RepID=A0A7R9JQ37_TIMGE|nr:unnamed protein product [Timema genevievae]
MEVNKEKEVFNSLRQNASTLDPKLEAVRNWSLKKSYLCVLVTRLGENLYVTHLSRLSDDGLQQQRWSHQYSPPSHNAGLSPSSTQGSEKVPLDENETQVQDMKEELQTADIEDGFTNIDTNGLKPVEEEADEVKEDTDLADKSEEGSELALGTAVAVAGAVIVVGVATACELSEKHDNALRTEVKTPVAEQEEGPEKSSPTVGTQKASAEMPDDSPVVKEDEDQVINETESLVEVAPSPVPDGTSVISDEIHGLSRSTSVTSGEPKPMGAEEPLSDVSIVESSDPEGSVSGAKEGIVVSPETAIGQESGQPISVTNSISEVDTSVKEYSLSESNEMQSLSRPISVANSVPTPDDSGKDVGETQLYFQKSTSRPTSSVGLILETEDIEPEEIEISIKSVSNTVTPLPTGPDKDYGSSRPSSVANSEMGQKQNLSFVEDKLTPTKLEEDSSRPISVSNSLIEDDEALNNSKKEVNAVVSLVEEHSSKPISVTNFLVDHNETAKNVEEEVDVSLPPSEKDLSRPNSVSVSLAKKEMYVNKDEEPSESNPLLIRPLSVTKSIINESIEDKTSIELREESIPSRPTSVSNILADTDILVKNLEEEIPFINRTDEAILSEIESSVISLEENTSPVEPIEIKDSQRPTSVATIANDEKFRDENKVLPQLIENSEEEMSKHVNSGAISPFGPKKEVNNEITCQIETPKRELVPENDESRSTSETKSEIQEVQEKEIRPLSASGNNTEQDIQSIDTKTGSPNKLEEESGITPTSALEPEETSDELPTPPNESELKEDLLVVNNDLGHINKSPLDIAEEIVVEEINGDGSQLPMAPESIQTLPESIGELDISSEYSNDISADINITEGVNDKIEREEDNADISIAESNKGISDSTIISTDFNDVTENKLDDEIIGSEKNILNEQETISTQDKFSEMFGGPIPTINLIESEDIKLSDSDEERETNEYVVVSQYEDEVSKSESTDLSSPNQFNELKGNEDVEKAPENNSINKDDVENLSRAGSTISRDLGNAKEAESGNKVTQEKEEEAEVNKDDNSIIEDNFVKLTNDDSVLVESLPEQSFIKENNCKIEVDTSIERTVLDDDAQIEVSEEEGVKTIEESLNDSNESSQWTLNLTDMPTSSTFEDHGEKEAGEPQIMEEAGTESLKETLKDSEIFNLPLTTCQEDVTQFGIRPDTSFSIAESREDSVLAEKGSDVESLTSIYTMKENDGFIYKTEDRAESEISICKSEGKENNMEGQENSESNETEKIVLPETLNKDNLEEEGSVLSSKSVQEVGQETDVLNSAATTIQASFRGFQTRQGLHKDTITAKVPDAVPSQEIDTVIQDSMFGTPVPVVSPSPDNQASIDITSGKTPFQLISVASPEAAQTSSSIEKAGDDPGKDQGIDDVDLVNLQKPQECDELPEDRGEGSLKEDEDDASSSADAESSLSSAATKIQAGVRGYLARKQIQNLRDDTNATSLNTQPSIPDSQQSFGGLSTSIEENGVHTSGSLETEVQKQQQSTLEEIEDSVIAGGGLLTDATRYLGDIGDKDAKEMTKILSLDSHLDSLPLVEKVEVKSTASLQEPPAGTDSEEDQKVWETLQQELSEAATRIQSNYRGYRTRQKLTREDAVQLPTTSNSAASSSEGDRKTPTQELRNTGEFHDMMVLPTEDIAEMTNDSSMYRKMKA